MRFCEGLAELGFVEGEIEEPSLASVEIASDQLIVVVGAQHPWTARDRIEPGDILETDWVLRERGSGTRSVFESALRTFGVAVENLRVTLELPSNEAVRAAVEAGMGATAISASVAVGSLEAELLHRVEFDLPARRFRAIVHKQRHRSAAAQALLEAVGASWL